MAEAAGSRRTALLTLVGALGVVFGDIGTSPLYAMRTILGESDTLDTATVYGMTSMVIWSLLLVVTLAAAAFGFARLSAGSLPDRLAHIETAAEFTSRVARMRRTRPARRSSAPARSRAPPA